MPHIERWVRDGKLERMEIDGVPQPVSDLGDKIYNKAQPIAGFIDRVAGTKVSGCAGCKKMRERLNAGMTIAEATEMRMIEFSIKKLNSRRNVILKKVDARLKASGK